MKIVTPSQQLAIATGGNVLVVAGAGTGKTTTLVERCVSRLIEERCSIDRILMVTFTDAAAAEMRHRIREELQKRRAASEDPALAHHLDDQVALLDIAPISTLSSFCLNLVREHFYELALDPNLSVLETAQTEPLIARVLDEIFEAHYAGQEASDQSVQDLVRAYGGGSDAAVRDWLVQIHRYTQTLVDPQGWFDAQLALYNAAEPEFWCAELCRHFAEWRRFWTQTLEPWRATVPALDRILRALNQAECPDLPQLAGMLQNVRAALEEKGKKAWAGKKTTVAEIQEFISEAAAFVELAADESSIARDWTEARPHMLALLKLAQEFTTKFAEAKRELGGVDFADIEQCALELLLGRTRHELTALARSLREHFLHVFVDEYQDINEAQDRIIEAVSRGNGPECEPTRQPSVASTASMPGNRFLVGDVKQSIYRFRLADPRIFSRYHADWKTPGAAGRSLPLSDNFRSREGILKFVNAFFSAVMRPSVGGVEYPPEAHLTFANARERQALAHWQGEPRVELHLFSTRGDNGSNGDAEPGGNGAGRDLLDLDSIEREARFIARRFRQLHNSGHEVWDRNEGRLRRVRWNDMVVLMRSPRDRVETFARAFHAAGVPLRAARAGFYEAAEVRDFIGLMRLLDNPLQDIPLVTVLRSPLVGMSADELAEIRIAAPKGPFWRAANEFLSRRQTGDHAAANSARQKLSGFFRQFRDWRQLLRQAPLSRCLEAALVDTHYEAMLAGDARGAERIANVLRLIDLSRAYDPFQRQGLYRFLRFIEAQHEAEVDHEPAAVAAADAVQLVSIHKSKGLEFPVVALANIGGRFNERNLNGALLLSEPLGLCPKIFPADANVAYPSIAHWLARRNERRELWGEEMRLLYVALTRARDTLILVGTASRKQDAERWECPGPTPIEDWELLNASSYLGWLRLWLERNTKEHEWTSDRAGKNPLLDWSIYAADDPVLRADSRSTEEHAAVRFDRHSSSELLNRISSAYPHGEATREPAKTSVSALRRRMEETEEAFPWFRVTSEGNAAVSARELGNAYHAVLEMLRVESAADIDVVRSTAQELVDRGLITAQHAAGLDLAAIADFWKSEVGSEIRQHAAQVHRELPFTARFTPAELAAAGLSRFAEATEFVVLQGVVDLAVLLDNEIWVLDFKSDAVRPDAVAEREAHYRAQITIYARALARIYGRPVTRAWLHFLAAGQTLPISVSRNLSDFQACGV